MMKAMVSGLVVTIMAFALVSSCQAGTWFSNDNPGAISAANNTSGNVSIKDADNRGNITEGALFPCGAEPAYPDYIDARAVPCTENIKSKWVSGPMGARD